MIFLAGTILSLLLFSLIQPLIKSLQKKVVWLLMSNIYTFILI